MASRRSVLFPSGNHGYIRNLGRSPSGTRAASRRGPSGATPTASTTPGRGERWSPPACERRSLLTGISHGEPSRREIRSENHTQPSQNGATSSRWTPSRHTLARTPGSRAIGGKAYRRSLGQVCTIASSPSGAGGIRDYQRGHCNVS